MMEAARYANSSLRLAWSYPTRRSSLHSHEDTSIPAHDTYQETARQRARSAELAMGSSGSTSCAIWSAASNTPNW